MLTGEALLSVHRRAHRNLADLLAHCRTLPVGEPDRPLEGFGYPSVRLQLHHAIGAEEYWVGVLNGVILVDEDDADVIAALTKLRAAGYKLVILSNGDRDMLKAAGPHIGFPFDLVADTDEALCQAFGVIKLKQMYGKQVRGIERSTFLVDADGGLRREWRGVKVAGHVAEVLEALAALGK